MTKSSFLNSILLALLVKYNYVFILILLTVGLVKGCASSTDPIDRGTRSFALLKHITVSDTARNGFQLYFRNYPSLTEERINLFIESQKVKVFFSKLDSISIGKYDNLIYTDPYDVVDIIHSIGIPDSIQLYYLNGFGKDKHAMYCNSNPYDTSLVTSPSPTKEYQGMVYLESSGISSYLHHKKTNPLGRMSPRYYGYKDASFGSPILAKEDEQFTHIHPSEARD